MLLDYRMEQLVIDQLVLQVSSDSTQQLENTKVVRMDPLSLTLLRRVPLQRSRKNQQQVTDQLPRSLVSSALLQNQRTTFSSTSTTCTKNQLRTTVFQAQT